MILEMPVPSPGESISEVEIAQWLVEDGDYVEFYLDMFVSEPGISIEDVTGRDIVRGIPKQVLLEASDVRNALQPVVNDIIEAIRISLSQTPPALVSDIDKDGAWLTGGGSLLKQMDKKIAEELADSYVNVFDNPEFYAKQFDLFIDSIVDGGVLIFNELDSLLSDIVKDNNSYIRKIEYNLPEYSVSKNNVFIKTSEGNIPLQVFGEHNLSNIEAAKKICSLLGVLDDDFYNSISTFKGASKRLEIIYKGLNNLLIRDFAHSPSKLKASVNAVRETFSNKFLIAVFELHTFSSLDPKFIQQYSGCLDNCDLPIIFLDNNNKKIHNSESINDEVISSAFNIKNLIIIKSNIDLFNYLTSLKYDNACLLLMSSGNFGLLDLDDIKKYMNNER